MRARCAGGRGPRVSVDVARRAALDVLWAVTEEKRLISEVSARILGPLSPPDRARALRLASGTLRWMDRCDRALGPHLRMRPYPGVHNAMRLAIFEMYVGGAAPHGAVAAAVDLVRAMPRGASQAGLTNGVLRNVVRRGGWDELPGPSLPKWLRKPLVADYGKSAVAAMERAFARGAPLDLTVRGDAAAWAERLGGAATPTGSVRLSERVQVSALPGYAEGAWWVQDAAAAIPARVLGPKPGETVIDLCAAPGGKTLQMAAAGANVIAVDSSAPRLERLRENLARARLGADVIEADALEWRPPAPADAVLLDAPCSATGTIRRHPDLPHAKTGEDFPALFDLQARLMDAAARMLKPGGRLVFCTCSLLIDEGEEQVRDALTRHDFVLDPAPLAHPGIEPSWIGPEGLRLRPDYWPERGGMDGFFVAAMRRPP